MPIRSYVISLNPASTLFSMRMRIQKATNRLREHLPGAGQGNPMKIPRKHILVVESGGNSVVMLQLYLGHVKYRVTAANTCGECLQLARIKRVDLYLLGDGCEDGGAFELCRKIRALDSDTPIIFCSADASPTDRQQGMSAGAQAYLAKPCELQELRQTIRCLISGAGALAPARTERAREWRRAKQRRGRKQDAAFITMGIERKHDHDSRNPSS
jgi:DNA-binding response OmpR family regulator